MIQLTEKQRIVLDRMITDGVERVHLIKYVWQNAPNAGLQDSRDFIHGLLNKAQSQG